jgi:hypothetical protein
MNKEEKAACTFIHIIKKLLKILQIEFQGFVAIKMYIKSVVRE